MNPFTPSFGTSPPVLVGRDGDLEDFREGLQSGPGAPERATLVTGLRGTGKTVMLNAYQDVASEEGWLVVAETATPGLLVRLTTDHLPRLLAEHDDQARRSVVTGGSVAGVSVNRELVDQHQPTATFRSQLTALATLLGERGAGIVITVDEVHRRTLNDLRQIGADIQHAFREDLAVAFVAAGLPSAVDDLLNDDVSTFLRRADRRHLREVDPGDVARALREPIEFNDRTITDDALAVAVDGTAGYPFMVQLVGRHSWRAAGTSSTITVAHVEQGISQARRKIGQLVHAPALADLSETDRSFLAAMAPDDGPSRTRDIADRLDVDANFVNQYRSRLLAAEMIEPAGHGLVAFTLPGLRAYLLDHAATIRWHHQRDL